MFHCFYITFKTCGISNTFVSYPLCYCLLARPCTERSMVVNRRLHPLRSHQYCQGKGASFSFPLHSLIQLLTPFPVVILLTSFGKPHQEIVHKFVLFINIICETWLLSHCLLGVVQNCQHYEKHTQSTFFVTLFPSLATPQCTS